MSHVDEHILEMLAINPAGLSEGEQQAAGDHVRSCAACAEVLAFLKTFHADLETLPELPSSRREAFFHRHSAFIIQLRPYKAPAVAGEQHLTVLAAMTHETGQRFSTIATLAAEAENTLVRLMYDSKEDMFKLYVLADNEEKRSHAIISIPELSVDLVTDAKGCVDFRVPPEKIRPDWSTLGGVLLTTVATITVLGNDLTGEARLIQISDDLGIRVGYRDGILSFEILQNDSTRIKRALVRMSDDRGVLVTLTDNKGECVLEQLPDQLSLRFYC